MGDLQVYVQGCFVISGLRDCRQLPFISGGLISLMGAMIVRWA